MHKRSQIAGQPATRDCRRCAHVQAHHSAEPCKTCLRDDQHPGWRKQSAAQRKKVVMDLARAGGR